MGFRIRCGLNLSTFLPRPDLLHRFLGAQVRPDDLRQVVAWGFDHVRLPIVERDLYANSNRRRPAAWRLLGQVVDWSLQAGLKVVVDLHRVRSHNQRNPGPKDLFSSPAAEERLALLWSDLAGALRDRPLDALAYDLFGEGQAPTPEDWSRVTMRALAALRRLDPERRVYHGGYRFRSLRSFALGHISEDPNLELAFHCYQPRMLAHYGLAWSHSSRGYAGPIRYPGVPVAPEHEHLVPESVKTWPRNNFWNEECSREILAAQLARALHEARQQGRHLYCAEFGCSRLAPRALREAWFRDLLGLFRANRIPWCLWEYRGDFGLIEPDGRPSPLLPLVLEFVKSARE